MAIKMLDRDVCTVEKREKNLGRILLAMDGLVCYGWTRLEWVLMAVSRTARVRGRRGRGGIGAVIVALEESMVHPPIPSSSISERELEKEA
jgi:hypothetical protein